MKALQAGMAGIIFIVVVLFGASAVSAFNCDIVDRIEKIYDAGDYDRAVAEARAHMAEHPDDINILYYEIRAGRQCSDPDEYIDAILSAADDNYVSRFRQALMHFQTGYSTRAQAVLEQLEQRYPDRGWVQYWLGQVAEQAGRDSLAMSYYTGIVDDSACRPLALSHIAYLHRLHGDLDLSDSTYALMESCPCMTMDARIGQARNLGLRGYWDDALAAYTRIADEYEESDAYSSLARTFNYLGRYPEAYEIAERARKKWPRNKLLRDLCAWIGEKLEKYDVVAEMTQDFTASDNAYHYNDIPLSIARSLNDTLIIQNEAREMIRRQINYDYISRVYIGWLDERNRQDEADSLIVVLDTETPPPISAFVRASRIDQDEPEAALAILDLALPDWSRFDFLMDMRIEWLMKSGRRMEAYEISRRILEKMPGNVSHMMSMAENEYNTNNKSVAEEWLDRIDAIAPGNFNADRLRLDLLIDKEETHAARELLDSLTRRYPDKYSLLWYVRDLYWDDEHRDSLAAHTERYDRSGDMPFLYALELSMSLSALERYDEAVRLLQRQIEAHPNAAELYYYLGIVHRRAGNYELSDAGFSKAQQLDPFKDKYKRGAVSSAMAGQTLESFTGQGQADTAALAILPVDSVLALAAACSTFTSEYGGVVVLEEYQHIIRSEYRRLRRIHRIVKLDSPKARENYGSQSFTFDSWDETPHLIFARVIKPDGAVFDVKPDQVFVVASEGSETSDSRSVTWSNPSVANGDVLEYVLQFQSGHAEPFGLFSRYLANGWEPVQRHVVELQVPQTWPIHYEATDGMRLTEYDSSGVAVYRWVADSLPTLTIEMDCPHVWEQGERLFFGYEKTWRDEADWYWKKIVSKLDTTAVMNDLVRSLIETKGSREDTIAALYDFVAREIRYVAIEFGEGSIIPRPPVTVLENRYGDCKDKSILLVSLLRAAGIEAYPALINSADTIVMSRDVPDISVFDHMIAYLPEAGGRFIDGTCEMCTAGDLGVDYLGKPCLIIGSEMTEPLMTTPAATVEDNAYYRTQRMVVREAGGVDIYIEMEFNGEVGRLLKGQYRHSDTADIREFIEDYTGVGLWQQAKLAEYTLADPDWQPGMNLEWSARMTVDSAFMKEYDVAYARMWFYALDYFISIPDTIDRTLDVDVSPLFRVVEDYVITAGDEWEVDDYRLGWTMDTTWFIATCTSAEWNDTIHVNVAFELKTTRIPVDELAAFTRAIVLVKARATNMSPYFRKVADAERKKILEEAIAANPNDLSLLITLANLYLGGDNGGSRCKGLIRREKARDVLNRALALQPSNETVAVRLARLYTLDGEYRTADSILTSFVSTNQASLLINLLQAGVAGDLARYAESEALLLKIMSQAPNDEMRVLLVEVYAQQGKHAEAQNQIKLLQTLRADSMQIMRARHKYYTISDSLDTVEDIIGNWPDTSKFIVGSMRVDLYSAKGEYDKALHLSRELLAEYPDNTFFLNNTAWFYAMTETNLSEALAIANRALGLRGECETSIRNTRGVILLKMGRLEEAKADLTWCLQNQSAGSQTVNYYFLGECALVEDDRERAIEYFTMARDAGGDLKYVKEAQLRLDELAE